MVESADSGAASNIQSPNFSFAFDNVNFSDRMLRIEVMAEPWTEESGDEDCKCSCEGNREEAQEIEQENKESKFAICEKDQILRSNSSGSENGVQCTDQGEEAAVKMVSPSGGEVADDNVPPWSKDCSVFMRVKKLHINSAILAVKSPYFYKLFSNGMHESELRDVKLQISASEEDAFMELLKFMYSGILSTTAAPAFLRDLLVVADKFEVASCVRHCIVLLGTLPMTRECALQYLAHPYITINATQPLVVAAKQYLAKQYQDLFESHDELMALPLSAVEAVLSSDKLHVGMEDAVFDFALEWAHAKYPNFEERREILGSHIVPAICFSSMSTHKLRVVLECEDIDPNLASKLVARAFIVKAEEAELKHCVAECAYKRPPLKVIQLSENHALVFLDLRREECAALFPTGSMKSQLFYLNGNAFTLRVQCNNKENSSQSIGLYLNMEEGLGRVVIQYSFASVSKPSKKFNANEMLEETFVKGGTGRWFYVFNTPWASFIADDSPNFLNGLLHLRVEVAIRTQ
ncbi:BTB/POZ domain-containing protein POB1 isoform X1 [Amborella trichopoda]|nr:BTB/POZ domain-containing protein POB1 isoform X1 [Amborella trichopoda]|eukprot:XP_020529348.1 BTB/POZ domain-containing protein POB1 isoform X1 [Amborella trichopoda]